MPVTGPNEKTASGSRRSPDSVQKATNRRPPGTHRPAIRGTNPRSRTCFPITPSNLTPGTQNGPRRQIRASAQDESVENKTRLRSRLLPVTRPVPSV